MKSTYTIPMYISDYVYIDFFSSFIHRLDQISIGESCKITY